MPEPVQSSQSLAIPDQADRDTFDGKQLMPLL
jgi:hypothetical protein